MAHNTDETSQAEAEMWAVMLGFLAEIIEQINTELRTESKLNLQDWILLVRLYLLGEPVTMSQLAREALFAPTRLSNRAKILEDGGLVERVTNPSSGRSLLISLTKSGIEFVERIRPIHLKQLHARYSSKLSPDENHQLTQLITRMLSLPAS